MKTYSESVTSEIVTAAKGGDENAVAFIMSAYKKKVRIFTESA